MPQTGTNDILSAQKAVARAADAPACKNRVRCVLLVMVCVSDKIIHVQTAHDSPVRREASRMHSEALQAISTGCLSKPEKRKALVTRWQHKVRQTLVSECSAWERRNPALLVLRTG
eukprot:607274-Amphidinium_carterae.1